MFTYLLVCFAMLQMVMSVTRRVKKKKRGDTKTESNDSPEVFQTGEMTADIPGFTLRAPLSGTFLQTLQVSKHVA